MIDASKHQRRPEAPGVTPSFRSLGSGACSLFAFLGAIASCGGTIDDAEGAAGDRNAASGGGGVPGVGGDGVLHPPASAPPSPDTAIRRLTRTEYNNTIRDLLGDKTQPGSVLDRDRTFAGTGFDNNADMLNQALPAIDRYAGVASDVVDRAFRAGSASRARVLTCDLQSAGMMCARSAVAAFAHKAWRRPVDDAEIDALMASALEVQADGLEEVVKAAFRMMLVSPNFLYRVEDGRRDGAGLHRLGDHELATRMSYFVWASTPDDRLLKAADDGRLSDQKVVAAELERMLADPKADALVDTFASQWLESMVAASGSTLTVADLSPDAKMFNVWNDGVRQGMAAETRLFFRAFLQGTHRDRDVADMLETDFTFANDALTKFYGMTYQAGADMKEVNVDGERRFGLLSQGGILALTSNANRTVPSRRGKFVLSKLLCSPPGEPPPNVPPLDSVKLPANASIRQKLDAHKSKGPSCAGCHAAIDPIGLALEHYDAIGRWRQSYAGGGAVDTTGMLPDGTMFDGAKQLSQVLKTDPRFSQCVGQMLFAYALGRDPARSQGDVAVIAQLATVLAGRGGQARDLVSLIVSSTAFQQRGGSR